MKYFYSNEKNFGAVVCYIFSVCLLLFGIAMSFKLPFSWDNRENVSAPFSADWYTSVIWLIPASAFIAWCGYLVQRDASNHRSWHRLLVEKGSKYKGTVTEIIESSSISHESSDRKTEYQFKVSYFDPDIGINKEFVTAVLSFIPDKSVQYSCDVYEVKKFLNGENDELAFSDTDSSLITIRDNKITFNFNPIKLLRAVNAKSCQKWFGNVIADNFQKNTDL